jgi:hypothetical protein
MSENGDTTAEFAKTTTGFVTYILSDTLSAVPSSQSAPQTLIN